MRVTEAEHRPFYRSFAVTPSISLLSLRDATGVKEEDTVGLISLLGLSETNTIG